MTTQEGNKLIADFSGFKPTFWNEGVLPNYHSDWNLLMPIVMKIIYESSSNCYFWANGYLSDSNGKYGFAMLDDQVNGTEAVHETPITAVWKAIVTYLKNNNAKQDTK